MALILLVWPTAINHSTLMILVSNAKCIHFQPIFLPFLSPFTLQMGVIHKVSLILLILLQMLVKSFVSNVITDIPYNLSKYRQYKHVWKLFEVVWLHKHTVIVFYCLDGNKKLLEIFAYPSNNRLFYGPKLNLKIRVLTNNIKK